VASGAAKLVSASSIRLLLVPATAARTSDLETRSVETAPQIPLLAPVGLLKYVWDSVMSYPTRRGPNFAEPWKQSRIASLFAGIFQHLAVRTDAAMSVLRAVVILMTATALAPARTPLRRGTAAYTASLPSEIYADAPSGLFGARPDAYLALEIPVADDLSVATTKEELRGQVSADDVEEENEGSSFGLDLEMRRPGGFAPVLDASGKTQSKDWLHCLSTWPQSYVLRRISNPLGSIVVWSSLVAAWYAVFKPLAKPLGTGMHTLVGGALSLLLVFRTNTAYNRFWDGRSIFGSVATAARDVVEFAGLYRREIGVQRADRISSLLKAFPIALQLHLQGFRFSPTSHESTVDAQRSPDAACVGEKEVLRLFRRMGGRDPALDGGAGEPTIARDDFLRALRHRPEVAAALGVPTDLEAAQALDQLHRLKYDAPRDPEAGVGLRELASYYAPLDLWRALRRAGAETRDAVARSSNMPLAITTKIAQEIKGVAYAPDDSFTVRERLYLLKRVADLRSTIARAERIVQTPVPLHYARHTSRFLSVWCFTLPLCLAPTVPAVVLPVVVGLASWALLGLREIGLLIENPFRRSLQLTQCTDALGREIDETLALHR
jgi:predicted membrane chloride channel (bestrophin family)